MFVCCLFIVAKIMRGLDFNYFVFLASLSYFFLASVSVHTCLFVFCVC